MSSRDPASDDAALSRWERTFARSSRGIMVVDPVARTLRQVNPAFAAMHGGAVGDFAGRPLADLYGPRAARELPAIAERLRRDGYAAFEVDHVRADGTCFPVYTEMIAERGEDGRALDLIGWCEDLTEKRATEEAARKAKEMFETAFSQAPTGIAMIGLDGRFLRVNAALCEMLGREPAELVGATSVAFTHPDDLEMTVRAYERLNGNRDILAVEKRYLCPDGSVVWMATHGTRVHDEAGRPLYIVAHFNDITGAREAEARRAEANDRFETAFSDAPIGMALVGLDGRWLRVNRMLCELTGYSEADLMTRTFHELTHPADLDADIDHVNRLLAGEIERYSMEKRYFTAKGLLIWATLAVSLIRDTEGHPLYFISQIEDISERKRLEASLHRLADHDSLTDLWNRRRFEEELHRQVGRCQRYGEHGALLMIDLDDFKLVNDTHGHKAGDDLLKEVARGLSERLRGTDVIARLGGDEFAVLLGNVSPDQAAGLADQLRATVAETAIVVEGQRLSVTASVGLAFLDEHTASDDAALHEADTAMYDAKTTSRGGQSPRAALAAEAERAAIAEIAPRAAGPVRVLHCDDSEPYRRLVAEMLAGRDGLEVVADAASGASALAIAAAAAPDVVLLDARMPGADGGLVDRLRELVPGVKVVLLSGLERSAAPLADATDEFVHKSASFDELASAVLDLAAV